MEGIPYFFPVIGRAALSSRRTMAKVRWQKASSYLLVSSRTEQHQHRHVIHLICCCRQRQQQQERAEKPWLLANEGNHEGKKQHQATGLNATLWPISVQ